VRQHLDDLQRCLNKTLLTQEQQSETKGKDSGETVFEVLLLFLKENLSNALSSILIAGATEDHSNGKGGNSLQLNGVVAVNNNWRNKFEEVSTRASSVS